MNAQLSPELGSVNPSRDAGSEPPPSPGAAPAGASPPPVPPPEAPADDDLATLLSRLAGLQGQAVPAHRFSMLVSSEQGLPLASLDRRTRALELWRARFVQADCRELAPARFSRGDVPALWFSRDEQTVLLVRGLLGGGALAVEDPSGRTMTLTAEEAAPGQLLLLPVTAANPGEAGAPQRSAAEWFAFAIRRHRRVFFEAVFATFVVSIIGLVSALYTMQVYDRVVPTKGYATLWVLTIGVAIAIVLELTLKQVRALMVDRACKLIDQELSAIFFGKALDIRLDARPRTVGTFASQIRHFESVRNFMTSSTLFILADVPFALLFIGVIALLAGPVALVPLIMVPVAILAGMVFRGPIERATNDHMTESNRKNGLLIEAVDGIESIKAAAGEWKLLDRWRALTASIAASELRVRMLSTFSTNLAQTIQQASYVALIAVGAYAIGTGQLTMGALIACSIVSGRALAPMAQIPNLIVQWKHAKIALKSLDAIMAMPGDREPDQRLVVPQHCNGDLRMEEIKFAYGRDRPVLELPALSVGPGERVAILGAVGSGKSTLIKLMSGLYRPSAGTVFVDGVDVTHLAPEFVREHVGYLPQDVRLFNGTLRENLTMGLPTPSDSQIMRAAEMTGLDKVIQGHPRGLELEIAEGGRGLSGGQRQLVGLTRMLLARPRILLLDEPTASMDSALEARVMKHLFEEMPADASVIAVTHKPALLPHVRRLIVLDRGKVVLDGPRDQVLARLRQPAAGPAQGGGDPGAPAAGGPTAPAPPVAANGQRMAHGGVAVPLR
jgi:ATP-binding cassette subfamily C protein LapB